MKQWIFVVIQALSPFANESIGNTSQTDAAFLAGVSGAANIANLALFGCELFISDIVMVSVYHVARHHPSTFANCSRSTGCGSSPITINIWSHLRSVYS